MESLKEAWAKVKEYCKENISSVAYSVWINELSPVDIKGNEIKLYVKTPFQKSVIMDNYASVIKSGFESILGFDVNINIITEQDSPASSTEKEEKSELSSDYEYTFDNFVVGSSNKFAHAASLAVAENPAVIYNPLFIYGNSGLGKTHLLRAIQNTINNKYPEKVVRYVRAEDFMRELIPAIRSGDIQGGQSAISEFQNKYRGCDVFLVDDVQFFAGKDSTQEEFFNTFNSLYQDHKQIVMTSDRPPKDIKTLDERLRSRFESGLISDIQPPDFEMRVGIIQRKAQMLGLNLKEDVIYYIAEQVKSNIRQLEGVVKKLKAFSMLGSDNPNISMAQNAIRDIRNDDQPEPITVERIINEVARTYMVTPEDIRSQKRDAPISRARQIAMYIVREITSMPYVNIGKEFGDRDHTTVVYAIQKIEKLLKRNSHEKATVDDIIKNIQDK